MNSQQNIAIIGSGNIGLSLAKGLVKGGICKPQQIMLTRRNITSLSPLADEGYYVTDNNLKAVKRADIVVLAVLPQQLNKLLDEIKPAIKSEKQLLISVISGVTCSDIRQQLDLNVQVIRAMPNTAIAIGHSMTCIATDNGTNKNINLVKSLFDTVGVTIQINEELMTSATALCACGIAFFLRSIRATSPRGCTIAGLNEMEHNGFSSAMIKGIKLSAEKAGDLYKKTE